MCTMKGLLTQKESPTRGLTSGLWERGSPKPLRPRAAMQGHLPARTTSNPK
jgi:hypothetical protein